MYVAVTGKGKSRVIQFRHDKRIPGTNKKKTEIIETLGNYEKMVAEDPNIIKKLKAEAKERTREQKEANAPIRLTVYNQRISEPGDTTASFHIGHSVLQKLWKDMKLDACIRRLCSRRNTDVIVNAIQGLLYHRLTCPQSVLASVTDLKTYAGIETINLDVYYQALTVLSKIKDELIDHFCAFFTKHTSRQGPMAYYDVTTHAFESVKQGELRMFGFSKDHKNNEVQVVMGMLIDNNGIPISFELFPGNTMDQKTLETAVKELKKKYHLDKIVIVADRGLNGKDNLLYLLNEGHSFVFAYTLKRATEELQTLALDKAGWKITKLNGSTGEILRKEKVLHQTMETKVELTDEEKASLAGRRGRPRKYKKVQIPVCIHLTWTSDRAKKDRQDRERTIKKVRDMLERPSAIKQSVKRGKNQYLDINIDTETARLDEQKIDRQAQFDGYYAIITNETDYSTDTVSKLYGGLWKIEESFRVLKTDLAASPAFVWRDDRVLGHFTLCFMALCFLRYTQYVLEDSGKSCASAAVLMNSWQQASVTVVGEYPDIRLSPTRLDKVYLDLLQCLEMKPLYTYMTPYEFRIATGLKVNAQLQDYYNRTQKK
jgi:transposase